MSILVLKSDNENMSHIISKNPASGMAIKKLRKGTSYAWYGNENTFLIYFKDSINEVSYSKTDEEDFEYNNLTRYNSPVTILNMITDFLNSASKKIHELDVDGFDTSVELHLEVERFNLIQNMFYRVNGIDINYTELGGNNYKVNIKTNKGIHYILNFLNVYCLFVAMIDGYYMNITDDMIKKYVVSLNKLGGTYYMKYLFMLKVIPSKKIFESVREELEKDENDKLELMYGSTAEWRRDFVFKHLSFENDVVDVGCGEGYYSLPLAKKLGSNEVSAIDIDDECTNKVSGKAESRGYDNLLTFDSIYSYKKLKGNEDKVDVLLVEVIEHMEKEEAKVLIKEVLNLNFNQIFITSPVQEFNVHYDLANSIDDKKKNGFRHDDHKWEGTVDEFTELVMSCIEEEFGGKDLNLLSKHYMIGDKVNGYAPTQGFIISKV